MIYLNTAAKKLPLLNSPNGTEATLGPISCQGGICKDGVKTIKSQ